MIERARAVLRLRFARTSSSQLLAPVLSSPLGAELQGLKSGGGGGRPRTMEKQDGVKPGASPPAAPLPLSVPLAARGGLRRARAVTSCLVSTYADHGSGNEGGAAGKDQKDMPPRRPRHASDPPALSPQTSLALPSESDDGRVRSAEVKDATCYLALDASYGRAAMNWSTRWSRLIDQNAPARLSPAARCRTPTSPRVAAEERTAARSRVDHEIDGEPRDAKAAVYTR